ncbi:hypothetical protein AGMMS49928_15280 [Spirochaetia bacterium]|nr:hypothetical protein AGMMS49928_15280 [Spirochaetia bacterium]
MMKFFLSLTVVLLALPVNVVYGQDRISIRSFDDIFPAMEAPRKEKVFSPEGMVISTERISMMQLIPSETPGLDLSTPVLERRPGFMLEILQVIPYSEKSADLVTIYNALGKIRGLKGRLYHSATKNENIPLFEDATRIESMKKIQAIPDPPFVTALPPDETIYIRLKDTNFGNTYYRADISSNSQGLLYSMTNFKNLTYLLFPVIKENKFIAQLYLEPTADGILIYSIAGADVSDFVASKINVPSAVQKRLEVIIGWVKSGIETAPGRR